MLLPAYHKLLETYEFYANGALSAVVYGGDEAGASGTDIDSDAGRDDPVYNSDNRVLFIAVVTMRIKVLWDCSTQDARLKFVFAPQSIVDGLVLMSSH